MQTRTAQPESRIAHRRSAAFWLLTTLAVLAAAAGWKLRLASWHVEGTTNTAVMESSSWLRGTFEIVGHRYEVAQVDGHAYNVVGLFFTLVCTLVQGVAQVVTGVTRFPDGLYALIILMPLPLVAFWAFRQAGLSARAAAVFTVASILGTSLWPVLAQCGDGDLYSINHVIAVVGLFLIGGDLLGRRRLWPAGIGLCMAVWSRQMTCFYAPALLWIALRASVGSRSRCTMHAIAWIALCAGLPMALNFAKFGNPLETGYRWLYEGRSDPIARAAQACFYGPANAPPHFRAMWTALPLLEIRHGRPMIDASDTPGTPLWFTTPVVIGVIFTARRWWADPARRALMLASFAVMLALMGYHTTAAQGSGHYRYALDFLPIWLLCISPYLLGPSGRVWTGLAFAWSIAYFMLLVR